MKKLYVLLSCLVLVFVVQSGVFSENEVKTDDVKKPTIACAKCGKVVCTCKPIDPDEYKDDFKTPAEYKAYLESTLKSIEEQKQSK